MMGKYFLLFFFKNETVAAISNIETAKTMIF